MPGLSRSSKMRDPDKYTSGVSAYDANGKLYRLSLVQRICRTLAREWQLWVLMLPILTALVLFHYLPLYGVQIAFRDYKAVLGITGSKWVGMKHFTDFFKAYYAGRLIANTLLLNLFGLVCSVPMPIIMAILLNQMAARRFKRAIQTVIYIPHFISVVVLAGIMYLFLSPSNGIVNVLISMLGGTPIYFMMEEGWFRPLFILSDIWQNAGWSAIVYIAALTAIDQELYEAASVDGASKWHKIWYIDIPHLIPIIVMILILNSGHILVSSTNKTLLLQTPGNMAKSDIIGVYVYNQGLGKAQYSYTAAINLFVNVINFFMIVMVNWVARRVGETSLF